MKALELRDKANELLLISNNAKQQLQEIKTIETGVDYLNKVKAIQVWAKAEKKDSELQNIIAEQKLRTQRLLGRLLKESDLNKGASTKRGSQEKPRLIDFGVNKKESYTFQKIASLPEETFENEIETAKAETNKRIELTTSRMLKVAKQYEREENIIKTKEKSKEFKESNIKLLEGDFFDMINEIEDNSIDLLNTDPPYFILDNDWDTFNSLDDFLSFTEKWLKLVKPKLKTTGRIYISFSTWYQYDFYNILKKLDFLDFTYKQNIIWYYKNNNAPSNKKEYRYCYEPIFYLYGKDAESLNFTYDTYGEYQNNIWEIATPQSNFKEGKYHSAQKPLELYRRIIKTGSKENDTVLDCFAGSGTTGIICKELNRNCILIEKDIENIKIIKGRL